MGGSLLGAYVRLTFFLNQTGSLKAPNPSPDTYLLTNSHIFNLYYMIQSHPQSSHTLVGISTWLGYPKGILM